jgi:hypothetical protein
VVAGAYLLRLWCYYFSQTSFHCVEFLAYGVWIKGGTGVSYRHVHFQAF